jgi:hypothetical protein
MVTDGFSSMEREGFFQRLLWCDELSIVGFPECRYIETNGDLGPNPCSPVEGRRILSIFSISKLLILFVTFNRNHACSYAYQAEVRSRC